MRETIGLLTETFGFHERRSPPPTSSRTSLLADADALQALEERRDALAHADAEGVTSEEFVDAEAALVDGGGSRSPGRSPPGGRHGTSVYSPRRGSGRRRGAPRDPRVAALSGRCYVAAWTPAAPGRVRHVASPARPRFRGVTHQWAFPVAVVAGAILIVLASGARERVAAAVYAVSLAGLFGTSALYHRGPWSQRLRAVLRRIDHSMIFVLIAGTITLFALLGMPTVSGVVMLSAAWAAAAGGVVISVLWIDAPKPVKVVLYLAYPLVCVVALPEIVDRLDSRRSCS